MSTPPPLAEAAESPPLPEPPAAESARTPTTFARAFGIRARLSLVLALAAILPLAGSAAITTHLLRQRFREDLQARAGRLEGAAARAYERTGQELRAALARLAAQPLIDEILVDLAQGQLGAETERQALERMPGLMRAAGLQVLTVVDDRGRVVAAGHLPGLAGRQRAVPEAGARPTLARARVRRKGDTPELLTLEVTERVERYGARVHLVGGQLLEREFLERLLPGDDAQLRLVDRGGRELATAPDGGVPAPAAPSRIPLLGQGPRPEAYLELSLSELPLRRQNRFVTMTTGAAAGAGVLFALLLAALLAGRITRPLRALVAAAQRVAAGDLEARVPVNSRDEVGELAHTFNRMTGDINVNRKRALRAERLAAWQDIARRLAHEIKNPLSPIRTSVETLRKLHARRHERFDEVFDQATRVVLEEVARLSRIVSEFSRFARMPAPRRARRDLAQVVGGALGLYLGLPEEIVLEQRLEEGLWAWVDRDQITQVVLNLIQNAVHALGGAGHIVVRLQRCPTDSTQACLWVLDDGPGVDPGLAERLFQPYVTGRTGGTGLGLAVAERILGEHGGSVELHASHGELGGAAFLLRLPLAVPGTDHGAQATSDGSAGGSAGA